MLLNILLTILVIDAASLIGVILLQRSEGGALGMGGGGGSFLSARGAGDLLTRTTWVLATIALLICIAITLITGHNRASGSVADRINLNTLNLPAASAQRPQTQAPASGAAPAIPPLPGTAPTIPPLPSATPAAPALPTEAPRPVVRAPAPAPTPAQARAAAARQTKAMNDALSDIQIHRQGAAVPRVDATAPAGSSAPASSSTPKP